jgi:tetratricopeptide (TPR) repeat protein
VDDSPELTEDQLWSAVADAQGPERAELLHQLTGLLYERGNYQDAASTAEESADGFAQADLPYDEGYSRAQAGVAYQELGRQTEALSSFTTACDRFRESGHEKDCAQATVRAGQCLNALDRPQEALNIWDSAQNLFASIEEPAKAADVALDRGNLLGYLGRQSEALEVFQSARALRRPLGDAGAVVDIDDRIAAALIDMGRHGEALEVLRAVLRVRESGTDEQAQAYARYRYGWTLELAGQQQDAKPVMEQARAEYQRLDNTFAVARCDLILADCLHGLGQGEASIELYQRAASVFDALGADDEKLLANGNLAIAYTSMGDDEASAQANTKVLADAESLGNDSLAASIAAHLARCLLRLGRNQEARDVMATHQPPEKWRDNIVETSKYQVIQARLLLDERDFAAATDLAQDVISSLDGQQLTNVVAEAYGVLSDAALGTGQVGLGERYRGKAMGLYLAAGSPHSAEALAAHFLESTTPASTRPTDQQPRQNMKPADV